MDSQGKFKEKVEEFYSDIKSCKKIYEKLYANIPVSKDDTKYAEKANAYLNNLGIAGIIELLGFDKVNEAIFIWGGLHAMKYNRLTEQMEPDLAMRLQHLRYFTSRVKQEKKGIEDTGPTVNVILPDWYLAKRAREVARENHLELDIVVQDSVKVGENN
jgi:hypothetical protein